MNGMIFSIKRYAIHDGPGIRVTFFLKGCPMSCRWCHNPEGISPEQEEIVEVNRVGDREFRKNSVAGRYISTGEVLAILERERVFTEKSGGGVTFSGGEPLMQPEFLADALRLSRSEGFHAAVDTSGYCAPEDLLKILPHTDLFLFDLKHMDTSLHEKFTGVGNRLIIENFMTVLNSGTDMMLRIPVIPGFNDDPGQLASLRRFIIENRRENIRMINLLPFHRIGASKYRKFGRVYRMEGVEQPSHERMKELKSYFSETGIKTKIGG